MRNQVCTVFLHKQFDITCVVYASFDPFPKMFERIIATFRLVILSWLSFYLGGRVNCVSFNGWFSYLFSSTTWLQPQPILPSLFTFRSFYVNNSPSVHWSEYVAFSQTVTHYIGGCVQNKSPLNIRKCYSLRYSLKISSPAHVYYGQPAS